MLIVSKSKLPYRGRFLDRATDLVKSGIRVGQGYSSGSGEPFRCHVCDNHFLPIQDGKHLDIWIDCPNCKTPFIIEFI